MCLPSACHPRASLRTRGVGAGPAWKVASTKLLSARRRGWVPGAHTCTSGTNAIPTIRPLTKAIIWFCASSEPATSCAARTAIFSAAPRTNLPRTGKIRPSRTVPVCTPRTHPRRRADRSPNLATFHAGVAATPRVRRDARGWHAVGQRHGRVSPTRSARKMPRLGPDLHAQASERTATGLPFTEQRRPHRTRRGGEGHFLRNKRLH